MLFIDYHSRVPIYEQIKEQVIMLINTGVFKPGDRLPSIRNLSNELNINVNTIKRAFSELEHDGITFSAQGRGVFVSENPIGNKKVKSSALEDAKSILSSCKAKGVSKDEVVSLIDDIYSEDNRNDSWDARYWKKKNVEKKKIIGKVKFRYFPNPSKIE